MECRITSQVKEHLRTLADKYETPDFIIGDPSWWMHQMSSDKDRETLAFIASSISYGSRKQFMPKIEFLLNSAQGDVYRWVKERAFLSDVPDTSACFYRLYTQHDMNVFLSVLADILDDHGTIGNFVKGNASNGISAVKAITSYYAQKQASTVIPRNTTSACKRICMFLRWMVRDHSPVDLGLWSHFIDKRSLIMPMDTHVLQEANNVGLLSGRSSATMSTALKLTEKVRDIFPDDPLKADFALFGLGVDKQKK